MNESKKERHRNDTKHDRIFLLFVQSFGSIKKELKQFADKKQLARITNKLKMLLFWSDKQFQFLTNKAGRDTLFLFDISDCYRNDSMLWENGKQAGEKKNRR